MSERVTRRLVVSGRVQGVFFRESMRLEAERLGVSGWVCTVEAVVQGEAGAVEAMVRWARRGPQDAQVTAVEVGEASGDFSGFVKRP